MEVSALKASVSPTAFKTELKYLVKISLRDYTLILFEKEVVSKLVASFGAIREIYTSQSLYDICKLINRINKN